MVHIAVEPLGCPGYVTCCFQVRAHLSNKGVIRQLHHPVNRWEVRAEHAPPGLHPVLPGRTAGPATYVVDDVVQLLGCRPGLVGRVDMNLDMVRWVPHGHIGGDADQLFGLAVEQGLMAMPSFPLVVTPREGLQVHLGQEIMVAQPEATDAGDPFFLRLLFSLCRHRETSYGSNTAPPHARVATICARGLC